jgi:hypothetical protein
MLGTNNTGDRVLRTLPKILGDMWTDSNFEINTIKVSHGLVESYSGPLINLYGE